MEHYYRSNLPLSRCLSDGPLVSEKKVVTGDVMVSPFFVNKSTCALHTALSILLHVGGGIIRNLIHGKKADISRQWSELWEILQPQSFILKHGGFPVSHPSNLRQLQKDYSALQRAVKTEGGGTLEDWEEVFFKLFEPEFFNSQHRAAKLIQVSIIQDAI